MAKQAKQVTISAAEAEAFQRFMATQGKGAASTGKGKPNSDPKATQTVAIPLLPNGPGAGFPRFNEVNGLVHCGFISAKDGQFEGPDGYIYVLTGQLYREAGPGEKETLVHKDAKGVLRTPAGDPVSLEQATKAEARYDARTALKGKAGGGIRQGGMGLRAVKS